MTVHFFDRLSQLLSDEVVTCWRKIWRNPNMSWFTSVGETNLGNVRCELGKTMGVLGFPNVSSLGMFVEHFRSLGLRSCLRMVFSDLIFCSIPTSFWVERFWAHYHSPRPTPWISIVIDFHTARNLWLGSINRTTRGFTNQHRNGQQWSFTWSILARGFMDEAVGRPNLW